MHAPEEEQTRGARTLSEMRTDDYHPRPCPMCNTIIPSFAIIAHIPRCYVTFCTQLGIEPLCTCKACNCRHAHPTTSTNSVTPPVPIKPTKSTPPTKQLDEGATPLNKRPKLSPHSTSPTNNQINHNYPALTLEAFKGARCMICTRTLAPSAVIYPYIHVGKFRVFMIHMKKHLTSDPDSDQIIRLLDQELAIVRKNDTALTFEYLRDSQDSEDQEETEEHENKEKEDEEENEEEEQTPTKKKKKASGKYSCAGWSVLQGHNKQRCTKKNDGMLWIYADAKSGSEQRLYFCKGTHLTRYLQEKDSQGISTAPTSKKTQTKRK